MTYNGVVYPVFYGFVRTVEYDPGIKVGQAKIELVDLFSWLDTPRLDDQGGAPLPVIPRVMNVTTGQAIGLILDSVGWIDASMRSLDAGDTLPYFEALGDQTPLQLISDLVTANGGTFYIDASGRAVFEDRNTRWFREAYASIVNTMQAITPSTSSDNITNIWNGSRVYEVMDDETGDISTATGPVQTAQDPASRREYGDLSQDIQSKYWPDDTFVEGAMEWRLLQTRDPVSPIWNLGLDNRDDVQMLAICEAELLRRIHVSEARTGTNGDYFLEQIAHQASRADRSHRCSMILSERKAAMQPFRLDVDTIGGTSIIGF
jgi:hypothetical protein